MKVHVIPQPTNVVVEYEGKTVFCDTERKLINLIMSTRRMAKIISKDLKYNRLNQNGIDTDLYETFVNEFRDTVFEKLVFENPSTI